MLKLTTLLTVFTFILKAEAHDYGKGRYISHAACGVRPITMLWVGWPNQSRLRLLEGGTSLWRKTKRLIEAGHRGPTIMYSIWKIMCFLNIKACQHMRLHHQYTKYWSLKKHHMTSNIFSEHIFSSPTCLYFHMSGHPDIMTLDSYPTL